MIKLTTPGSAIGFAPDCATGPCTGVLWQRQAEKTFFSEIRDQNLKLFDENGALVTSFYKQVGSVEKYGCHCS